MDEISFDTLLFFSAIASQKEHQLIKPAGETLEHYPLHTASIMYAHETQVQDDRATQQESQRQERTMMRQMWDTVLTLIKRSGSDGGAQLSQSDTFHPLLMEVDATYNWDKIPPCPIPDSIKLLKYEGGDIQGAREKLARHAALFDAVTEHPVFGLVQQRMVEGNRDTSKKMSDKMEDLEMEDEQQQQQFMSVYDAAFMKEIGNGLGMSHRNVLCAIAHRHLLLDIIQLIDQKKISTALRELNDARTCEICRHSSHPAAIAHKTFSHVCAICYRPSNQVYAHTSVDGRPIRSAKELEEIAETNKHNNTAPPLHPLLQTICTVLDVVALQMDTNSLVMLHRTCRYACYWHPDIPIWYDGTVNGHVMHRPYGLATRLALSHHEQQKQRQQPFDALVTFHTSTIMCNNYRKGCLNLIPEVHEFTVNQRRKKIADIYNTCESREDVMKHLLCSFPCLFNFINEVEETETERVVFKELTEDYERSLLILACEKNNYQAIHFFMIEMGFMPCVSYDFEGTTPLHAAAVHCNLRIMKLLCSDGRVGASLPMENGQSILDKDGKSVLDVAIENGHVLGVQWLVEECGWNLDHNSHTYLNWSLRWINVLHESLNRCPEEKRGEMSILLNHYGITDGSLRYTCTSRR